jgi:hypothetical protein
MTTVRILAWSAWAPGLTTRRQWLDFCQGKKRKISGESPELHGISPLLRRRMSRLTRMSMAAALDCCRRASLPPGKVRVVLASRHGEMATAVKLLDQMLAGESLSPMDFSGSVHHTPGFYFSLVTSNRLPMHAVAAAGLLSDREKPPVLLIYGDDVLEPSFSRWEARGTFPCAAAILLAGEKSAKGAPVRFSMRGSRSGKPIRSLVRKPASPPVLQFLRWWINGSKDLEMSFRGRVWRWER